MNIKFLVMDVDGTLTDGKIYMGNDGEVMKAFSIKDGAGIHDIAIGSGIIPVIITGRSSKIVENRCRELGIKEIHQAVKNKAEKLKEILNTYAEQDAVEYGMNNVSYIGDDINDLAVMSLVKENGGVIGCPADAAKQVLKLADFISAQNGGDGAVREFVEWLTGEEE